MMPISTSSVFQPQTVDPTAPAQPLDSVTADGTVIQAVGDAPPPASVTVELSPNAQFINAVSLSQQQLTQLSNTGITGQQNTLLGAVQIVVDAFNALPAADASQTLPESANLQSQLVQSLNSSNTNPGAPGTAEALAQIGISLQSPQFSSVSGNLSLDSGVLASAFGSNGQATVSTLQQTLDSFSQIATQFAEQLSAASSSALPALTNTPALPLTPADVLENQRLSLDQAEVSALPPATQPVSAQSQASAPAAQATAAQGLTPTPTPENNAQPAQANALSYTQTEQASAAQAAIQQSSAGLNTVLTAGAEAAAQATAAQNAAAAAAQAASGANTGQNASANLAAANAAASAALEQAQAAQRAVDQLIQQHDAALAAAAQASASQGTGSAATQQASAAQTTAANLAAASAAVEAALQEARLAEDAASQAAQSQALLTPAPAATASATPAPPVSAPTAATPETQSPSSVVQQQLAEELDPLRANPALAGAIAAYNLAGGRVAATAVGPSATPQRVSPVTPATRTGAISDQRGRTT